MSETREHRFLLEQSKGSAKLLERATTYINSLSKMALDRQPESHVQSPETEWRRQKDQNEAFKSLSDVMINVIRDLEKFGIYEDTMIYDEEIEGSEEPEDQCNGGNYRNTQHFVKCWIPQWKYLREKDREHQGFWKQTYWLPTYVNERVDEMMYYIKDNQGDWSACNCDCNCEPFLATTSNGYHLSYSGGSWTPVNFDTTAGTYVDTRIGSGTYTPILSANVNLDAVAVVGTWKWMKVDSVLMVSGSFTADATSSPAQTSFEATLPTSAVTIPTFSAPGDEVAGTLGDKGQASKGGLVQAVTSSQRIKLEWRAQGTASKTFAFTCMVEL